MFKKKGIKLQVLISVLLLFVIISTVAIDWFISMNSYNKTMTNYHLDSNYTYVQKLKSTATHQLNYMTRNIATIGQDVGKHPYDQESLDEWLEANIRHFNALIITDPDGKIELISANKSFANDAYLFEKGMQLEGATIEKALEKKEPYISQPDYILGEQLMTIISAPIFEHETKEHLGMIIGSIHMQSDNVLKCIFGEHKYTDESYVFATDAVGNLIYHPNEQRLGEDVSENEVVQQALAKKDGSQKVINTEGNEFFASYTYLDTADWAIVVQTPTEIIQQPIRELFWRIVMLTVPFLIVILLISSFIVSRITKPLNTLANFSAKTLKDERIQDDLKDIRINTFVYEVQLLYSQLKEHLSMLNKQVTLDGLTQIYNRREFDLRLEGFMREQTAFSLIMLDIDHFKKVNDTYGHVVGDEVLQYLAKTMQNMIKGKGECFRYGGEEFAIILKGKSAAEAYEIAESLRETIANENSPTGKPIYISLGIAQCKTGEQSIQALVEKADTALYESKSTGRNKTTIYNDEL